ncbi:MAG TPA: diguanylate cyclase [Vicinamibacteria bacterium]|nr:diguanylate cyclase [Vicinamibacteria bacterium]
MEPWQEAIGPLDVDARRGSFPRVVPEPPLPAPAAEATPCEVGDQAAHDPLTGLSCRASLIRSLQELLLRPLEVSPFAVAIVDLDGFRATNQALGYAAGDRLLHATARRLETCLRRGDTLVRFGSDEFAILLADLHAADATRVGERLQAALSAPLDLGATVLCPQASVGIAVRGPHQSRPEDILRDAERALGRARAAGKGRYDVFDPRLDPRAMTLSQLEASLRRAIDSEDFRTHYEPMVSVKGGQVTGFEVVLWRKSGGGRARR